MQSEKCLWFYSQQFYQWRTPSGFCCLAGTCKHVTTILWRSLTGPGFLQRRMRSRVASLQHCMLLSVFTLSYLLFIFSQETTSMMPPDASRLFEEEILRLKRTISMSRSKLAERRRERDNFKSENSHLNATFTKNQYALKEAQSTLFGLEVRESELSAKVIGLDHLREQIRVRTKTF